MIDPLRPGQRFGAWEVMRELGRGGMGVVLEVRHTLHGTPGAMKVLLESAPDAAERERFLREARVCAALHHPQVVRVLEAGWESGMPWLVMELIQGESLAARLKRDGPLSSPETARIGAQLAKGLAHVHAAGALHRDLKPENVLLRADGTPVLVDFGLARAGQISSLSQTGQLLGTPAFMSPEQADGRMRDLDARADVYGLGATLYAMLTGKPPFTGGRIAVLSAVLDRPPAPPSRHGVQVDPALEALVLRCLAKEPAQRPPSAEALAGSLEALARQPTRAASGGRPWPALIAAGVLALGASAAGLLLVARSREPSPGPPPLTSDPPVPPPPQPPVPPDPAALLKQARALLDARDWKGLETCLGEVARASADGPALVAPLRAEAALVQFVTLQRTDGEAVARTIEEAVRLAPSSPEAHALLALLGSRPPVRPGWEVEVGRALELGEATSGLAWASQARLLREGFTDGARGDAKGLESAALSAVLLAPGSLLCWREALAAWELLLWERAVTPEEAWQFVQRAEQARPDDPDQLVDAGMLLKNSTGLDGKPAGIPRDQIVTWLKAAVERHTRALLLDPVHVRAYTERAWARRLLAMVTDKDYSAAISDARRAVELNRTHPHYPNVLSLILQAAGDTAGEAAAVREVLRRNPDFGTARQRLELLERTDLHPGPGGG